MRVISEERLGAVLADLPGRPRVVAGGNFATPRRILSILDGALPEYRLFMLNAQGDLPDRDGVVLETPFVGAGMRGRSNLRYFPSRLSLVPNLLRDSLPPDVVVVQTSVPSDGTVSLGIEVNILPAAIEAVRARGGLVVAQLNPRMPYTYGDAVLTTDEIDYAVESDEPLAVPATRPPGEVATEIGRRVARLVPSTRRCNSASAASPTPCWPPSWTGAASGCGRRCSATASCPWRRPGRSTPPPPSPPRSPSAPANSTTGPTATSASGCCARRRPTTPA
ncbi:hypothetical protein [Actinomadura madurae]|uniref:hypothetical protein n=1 Tax=Actinomadura madurae TaxID=1993 RepID=UPI001FD403E7|nr:hypothetical protein [Actinomadura madurae]